MIKVAVVMIATWINSEGMTIEYQLEATYNGTQCAMALQAIKKVQLPLDMGELQSIRYNCEETYHREERKHD